MKTFWAGLRLDPGQLTIGQLLQAREASLPEMVRLRACIDRLRGTHAARPARTDDAAEELYVRPGMLWRLTRLCDLLGVSPSSIYQ